MVRVLKGQFPEARIALQYNNPWELLVAVVLSAQATDKKVNEITTSLFRKYPRLADYTRARLSKFRNDIRRIGLYKQKAANILASARIVQARYHGKLPKTMAEMIALPGVGRKSANVILGNAYGIVEGIAVDTHVRRFAMRFSLSESDDPAKIEQDLMHLLPRRDWPGFTYRLIEYGRNICPARKHACAAHPLTRLYPSAARRWYSPR